MTTFGFVFTCFALGLSHATHVPSSSSTPMCSWTTASPPMSLIEDIPCGCTTLANEDHRHQDAGDEATLTLLLRFVIFCCHDSHFWLLVSWAHFIEWRNAVLWAWAIPASDLPLLPFTEWRHLIANSQSLWCMPSHHHNQICSCMTTFQTLENFLYTLSMGPCASPSCDRVFLLPQAPPLLLHPNSMQSQNFPLISFLNRALTILPLQM